MKRDLVRRVGGTLLSAAAMLAVLSACAGSTPAAPTPAAKATAVQPTTTAAVAPKPAATLAPTPAAVAPATPAAVAPKPAAGASLTDKPQAGGDQLAQGKAIFEKTAGGLGCAFCHGLDARGKGPSGLDAPNIRGKQEADIRDALKSVEPMSIVKLNDQEITAVATYLQFLTTQP